MTAPDFDLQRDAMQAAEMSAADHERGDPDQPPGITSDSRKLPPLTDAAERVAAFLSDWGDGRIDDGAWPDPPLFARDLEVLTKHAITTRQRDAEVAAAAVQPLRDLFAGGPDTACRTTRRDEPNLIGLPLDRVECVEVPMHELRAAFDEAEKVQPVDGTSLRQHDADVAAKAKAEALEDAIKSVQAVYDLQCPVDSEDAYVPGARLAHQWWGTVLGGTLDDFRNRAVRIREEATS